MFHEFLTSNRDELIGRCREKVAKRFEPAEVPPAVDNGVPLFLQQLIETLRHEQLTCDRATTEPQSSPSPTDMGRAAASHGAELLRLGFTVDQVVHEYGDVCQAVTELAAEDNFIISTDEFRTLNRCLDDAIADAVTSFGLVRQSFVDSQTQTLQTCLETFSEKHRRLVDIAIRAYSAIKTGNVGSTGATGALLSHTLDELRSLTERELPEIRV
jgi:hypothetical protein